MKKLKDLLSVLFLLTATSSLFAAGGILSGEKHLKVAKTTWFDIVYGDSCEDSAAVLYNNADQIYQDLADMYGYDEPPCRMPVVLTTKVENFNAYYSSACYNHIVLYVTSPIEECSFEPDIFLSTFRHELTHAFTYNMKSPFFKVVGKIFCDGFNFSPLTVTPGMAEGATLTSESFEGYGRLNDEYTVHMVKQAKLEDKFPEYDDVQGSKSIYSQGDFYLFNGVFHEYLQENFGMDKYTDFWFNAVNNSLTIKLAFKKAYGFRLTTAWDNFVAEYKVPDIPSNPVEAGLAYDFFDNFATDYSINNDKGAVYKDLSVSQKGITYVDLPNHSVYFVSKDDLDSGIVKPQKLFSMLYLNSANQSLDGRFVTASYYTNNKANYQYHVKIYDTETQKMFQVKGHGLKDGTVIKSGNDYYLVGLKFIGERKQIRISKLIFEDNKLWGEEEPVFVDFQRLQNPSGFVAAGQDSFAYVLKEGMNYSVQLMDLEGNLISTFDATKIFNEKGYEKFSLRQLSSNPENPWQLMFSWAAKGTMPRLGSLDLSTAEFGTAKTNQDISGGIFSPVLFDNSLYYIGEFFQQNRIFMTTDKIAEIENFAFELALEENQTEAFAEEIVLPALDLSEILKNNSKAYNFFTFMNKGIIYPWTTIHSVSYDSLHRGSKNTASYLFPFGLTYQTSNPWDSNLFTVSAGYGRDTNSVAMEVDYSGRTDTDLFSYKMSVSSEFDNKGFKLANNYLALTTTLNFGNFSTISLQGVNFIQVGRANFPIKNYYLELLQSIIGLTEGKNWNIGWAQDPASDTYLYDFAQLLFCYNNIHTVGDTRYAKKGWLAGFAPSFTYSYDLTQNTLDYSFADITLFGYFIVPQLLKFDSKYGMTYNLPTKFVLSLFSASTVNFNNIYYTPDLVSLSFESVLYARDIQKAVYIFPFFYLTDFKLNLSGMIGYDYVETKANFGITHVKDYVIEIADGTNIIQGALSLYCCLGTNLTNFGGLARSANSQEIDLGLHCYFYGSKASMKVSCNYGVSF